jgi:hypothetical protein
MTETFLPGDRVSIMATVTSIHEGSQGPLANMKLDGEGRPQLTISRFFSRLTLVERTVVLPVNPYDYGPDPETGQPRWEVQVGAGSTGWFYVSGVTCRKGVWWLHAGTSWSSPMGERPVRPVTR